MYINKLTIVSKKDIYKYLACKYSERSDVCRVCVFGNDIKTKCGFLTH